MPACTFALNLIFFFLPRCMRVISFKGICVAFLILWRHLLSLKPAPAATRTPSLVLSVIASISTMSNHPVLPRTSHSILNPYQHPLSFWQFSIRSYTFILDCPICIHPSAPSYPAESAGAGFNPWHEAALPDYPPTGKHLGAWGGFEVRACEDHQGHEASIVVPPRSTGA